MLLAALVAFAGTAVALYATFTVPRRTPDRRAHLIAWAAALACLSAGLGASSVALMVGFNPALFRTVQATVGLLAGLWIALGVVELGTRSVISVFLTRMLVICYSLVVGVVLAVDPLRHAPSGTQVPDPGEVYLDLPIMLLTVSHVITGVLVCLGIVAAAMHGRTVDSGGWGSFLGVLLAGLAGVLVAVATEPSFPLLPGLVYALLLVLAVGSLWAGAVSVRRAADDEAAGTAGSAGRGSRTGEDSEPFLPLPPENPENWSGPPGWPDRSPAEGNHPAQPSAQSTGPFAPVNVQDLWSQQPQAGAQDPTGAWAPERPWATANPARQPPAEGFGILAIFTLVEGTEAAFDRLAEQVVRSARENEPGILLYTCHSVVGAPQQRIFYELYRDREAYEQHRQHPEVLNFDSLHKPFVLATNVIELQINVAAGVPELEEG